MFLTGQAEVKALVRKLHRLFPANHKGLDNADDEASCEEGMRKSLIRKRKGRKASESGAGGSSGNLLGSLPNINLDNYKASMAFIILLSYTLLIDHFSIDLYDFNPLKFMFSFLRKKMSFKKASLLLFF